MEMRKILPVVAESFGIPVTCHPDEPAEKLYGGRWDGQTISAVATQDPLDFLVIGTFSPEERVAEWVWAFNLTRYRDWFVHE